MRNYIITMISCALVITIDILLNDQDAAFKVLVIAYLVDLKFRDR